MVVHMMTYWALLNLFIRSQSNLGPTRDSEYLGQFGPLGRKPLYSLKLDGPSRW